MPRHMHVCNQTPSSLYLHKLPFAVECADRLSRASVGQIAFHTPIPFQRLCNHCSGHARSVMNGKRGHWLAPLSSHRSGKHVDGSWACYVASGSALVVTRTHARTGKGSTVLITARRTVLLPDYQERLFKEKATSNQKSTSSQRDIWTWMFR